jgi:NAD(P)-dependent dehydrogenase (short-subunit alcohol dehydrogenase family)
MQYQNKVAIVTGAASGIGAGCARVFVEAGAYVVIADRQSDKGIALADELNTFRRGKALFVHTDITDIEQIRRMIETTVEQCGRLDCLINNAGWHPPHLPIDEFSVEDFRSLLELNVVSVFAACQLALPHLRRTRGNIINIASLVASIGQLHATTYVATKGAVLSFTKALAIDEARHGVRVNSISPGNIWTPLWEAGAHSMPDPAAAIAEGEAAQVLGRMGTPEEAGKLCLFLAAEATFTTGVDHILSGGAELAYGRKVWGSLEKSGEV